MPARPILYVRLSRDDLSDRTEPIAVKLAKLVAIGQHVAHQHGLRIAAADVYQEVESGASNDRQQLQQLLTQVRRGEVSHFVTPYQDRLLRGDLGDVDEVEDALIEGSTKLVTSEKLTDFGHEDYLVTDALLVRMKAVVDNQYVQSLIKKRKEHNRSRARSGLRSAGYAPFGYKWVPARYEHRILVTAAHYEIVEDEYVIVLYIFERIAEIGIPSLLEELNTRLRLTGAPLPPGARRRKDAAPIWRHSALHRILHNPHYAGLPAHRVTIRRKHKRKSLSPDEWIMPDTEQDYPHPVSWERMQEIWATLRKRTPAAFTTVGETRLLTGLLRCPRGEPMRAGGKTSYACRCRHQGERHAGAYIHSEIAEEIARRALRLLVEEAPPDAYRPQFAALSGEERARLQRECQAAQKAHTEAEGKVRDLITNRPMHVSLFGQEMYEKVAAQTRAELDAATRRVETLRAELDRPDPRQNTVILEAIREVGFDTFWSRLATAAERRDLLHRFIARLDVEAPETPRSHKRAVRVSYRQPFDTFAAAFRMDEVQPAYQTARRMAGQTARAQAPCDCGCGRTVDRQQSKMQAHNFASRQCYQKWRQGRRSNGESAGPKCV